MLGPTTATTGPEIPLTSRCRAPSVRDMPVTAAADPEKRTSIRLLDTAPA
jgi:hypothetical protein